MPISVILAAMFVGAGIIFLLGVNLVQFLTYRREATASVPSRALGKWAWGISLLALLVPYLAPISLTMAVIDVRRPLGSGDAPSVRRPAKMALLNSGCALLALIIIFGVMLGTGIIRRRA